MNSDNSTSLPARLSGLTRMTPVRSAAIPSSASSGDWIKKLSGLSHMAPVRDATMRSAEAEPVEAAPLSLAPSYAPVRAD